MRQFPSGSTRGGEKGKLDFEGFLSPLVVQAYAEFVHKHRIQEDGKTRDSDNWQKGIPFPVYMKSMWRHFMDVWTIHRKWNDDADIKEALCALMFNAQGYLHEILKRERLKPGDIGYTYTDSDGITTTIINANQKTPTLPPATPQEWLAFQRNMTAASLPSEDDENGPEPKELKVPTDPQFEKGT